MSNKIVLGYYEASDNVPYIWKGSGLPIDIPLSLYPPSAMSGDGSIVVGAYGWRWNSTTGLAPIALKNTNGDNLSANDVSTDGKVIVGTLAFSDCVKWWGASFATFTDLGVGDCRATNGDGTVIVGADTTAGVAAYWDNAGTMHDIPDVAGSPDLQGWSLIQANGVSDDGKFIVGTGFNGNKQRQEGWVVHLP